MFDLETREFSASRDVTFIEEEFPFYENLSTTTREQSVDISEVSRPLVDDINVVEKQRLLNWCFCRGCNTE